jgi:hypothetical protein
VSNISIVDYGGTRFKKREATYTRIYLVLLSNNVYTYNVYTYCTFPSPQIYVESRGACTLIYKYGDRFVGALCVA